MEARSTQLLLTSDSPLLNYLSSYVEIFYFQDMSNNICCFSLVYSICESIGTIGNDNEFVLYVFSIHVLV